MGRTALHYAAAKNEIECMQELLANGAYIDAQTLGGDTSLIKAVELGRIDAVYELIDWNCNFNIQNKFNETALDIAKVHGADDLEDLVKSKRRKRQEKKLLVLYLWRMNGSLISTLSENCARNICQYICGWAY
eukprot:TRINITY_DN6378_c0_g1_i6.p1 TRINITY_DN6378_c0_g1~~TRINITY_DN6378_c0_g1_i6.p1  ORF type:complete len:133 (-),score=39.20 TRINITY_DN6378_c0_g1_i6:133-531(-)